jgi:hypothetical protein
MSAFAVARVGSSVVVGPPRPHPERAAIVEGRGALLLWDALDPRPHPAAEIHDPGLAADWLWDVYGREAADAVLDGADAVTVDAASPVLDAARALAHLRWAEAWWPSSHAAAVPALSIGLLHTEAAWRTAALEHLLDDDEAVERALADVDLDPLSALEDDPLLGAEARELAANLARLAEDYGVALRRAPLPASPEDFALAAGNRDDDGLVLTRGSAPVDWSLVPQGLVDGAGEAEWALKQRDGAPVLAVAVPAAPNPRGGALTARIGTADVELRLDPSSGTYTGETAAPQGFLMLRAEHRTLSVVAPGFSTGRAPTDPDAAARRAALIVFARERLAAPDACLAERAAARGIGPA